MKFPEYVKEIIYKKWNISENYEQKIEIEDLGNDYVIWEKNEELILGGIRLVISKESNNYFELPSYCSASQENGVSWNYSIIIKEFIEPTIELAKIFEVHTGISAIEAYKGLKKAPIALGQFYIAHPLKMINELKPYNISIQLLRPDNTGGYCME